MYQKVTLTIFAFLFVFVASNGHAKDKEDVLNEILNKDIEKERVENEFQDLRPQAIREAAHTLAFQKAVRWRYKEIVDKLEDQESKLNSLFDFNRLMLNKGRVVPPVIVRADKGFEVKSDELATQVENTYRIIRDARLTSIPPSWRDYLVAEYQSVDKVNPAVLPKDDEEQKIWDQAAREGFEEGLDHADHLYKTNLSRLSRDFRGILRFKLLAEQNIVQVPVMSEGELGVRVEDKVLDVDQKVFRITKESMFNEVKEWNPAVGE